jgi:hypothetical protein
MNLFSRGLLLPFFLPFGPRGHWLLFLTDIDSLIMSLPRCRLFEAQGHCMYPFTPTLTCGVIEIMPLRGYILL